jgi:hypothetical protein
MKKISSVPFFTATTIVFGLMFGGCATDKAFQEAMAKKEEKEAATGSNIMRKDRSSDVVVVNPDALIDKRNNPSAPKAGN